MSSATEVEAWIVARVVEALGDPGVEVDPDAPLADFGLSSRQAVTLVGGLAEEYGVDLEPTVFWEHPTARTLAAHVHALRAAAPGDAGTSTPPPPAAAEPSTDPGTAAPIAVVGMAARMPGAADLDAYWELLSGGVDAVARGGSARIGSPRPHGLLDQVDGFDAPFFGVSAREAPHLDPAQRLLLEAAWSAVEHAAIDPRTLAGTRTGVFVGVGAGDYARLQAATAAPAGPHTATGIAPSITANRVSYALDLRGPSVAVDTACSSSLVAVHLAVRALRAGDADAALAAGVNLILDGAVTDVLADAGMMAADGRCKTFDAAADGYVRAEGCGAVLLKPLTAALRDGDTVYAVIRGTAINSDGRSNGLTAPNGTAQAAVVRAALADAGVPATEVDYVEAHGTGTPLGDPIEVAALCEVLGAGRAPDEAFLVGSVKTNIGHAEAAAGIAGLIKVALMLHHETVVPHLHLRRPNPGLVAGPYRVPTARGPWPRRDRPSRAGVSSFGFGGTNAHVVVEAAPAPRAVPPAPPRAAHLLPLTAVDAAALRALAGRYADHLRARPELSVADLAHTCRVGRAAHRERAVAVVDGRDAALAALDAVAAGTPHPTVHRASVPVAGPGRVAMVFTGQGAQYAGMAAGAYRTEPDFAAALDEATDLLRDTLPRPLPDLLWGGTDHLDDTRWAQPALVAVEVALARMWAARGLRPDVVVGHSLGQLAAACVAGVFDLADALRLAAARGEAMAAHCPPGAMLAVLAPEAEVVALLDGTGLTVAAVNGPAHTVVSGPPEAVTAFAATLDARGVPTRAMRAAHAFHSPMMAPAQAPFATSLRTVTRHAPTITLVDDLGGGVCDAAPDDEHWLRHCVAPVRFADAVTRLVELGCTTVVEAGPRPTLTGLGRRAAGGGLWVPSLRPDVDDEVALTTATARLVAAGHRVGGGTAGRRVALPGYPFQRTRHWFTPGATAAGPDAAKEPVAVATADPEDAILASLTDLVTRALDAPAPVEPDASFLELGADSIVLFQTLQSVQKTYQVPVAIARLFEELSTPRRLAAHLAAEAPPAVLAGLIPQPQPADPVGPPPVVAAAPAGDVARYLEVHERVMRQAYDLLRGGGTAPAPPPMAAPPAVAVAAPSRTVARVSADVYKPFRPDQSALASQLDAAQRAAAAAIVERYRARTAASGERAARERPVHADIRHVNEPQPLFRPVRYPLVVDRSAGSRVWDLDGHEYVDVTMGFGVNLFGHNEPFITDAVRAQLDRGMQLGPQPDLAAEVAELARRLTGKERVTFCNTGSEAVMLAIRMARAVTGRDKIAIFGGAYHGIADPVLAQQDVAAADGSSVPMAPGVPTGISDDVIVLPYGDESALAVLRERAGELAAVLVEPVQSRRPDLQPVQFLKELRELTLSTGVALIFDEVICGFRMHPAGAQGVFGIEADLATYGKVLGGGLPIGMVAGDARFLDTVDGGAWTLDRPAPATVRTFYTGTFCKHPLALAASRAVLAELLARGPGLQEALTARVRRLAERCNALFATAGVPIEVVHFGSLFRFTFPGRPARSEVVELFFLLLGLHGLYVWEGRNCFLSVAHDDRDVDVVVAAVTAAVAELTSTGLLPTAHPTAVDPARPDTAAPTPATGAASYPLSHAQREVWFLHQLGADRAFNETALLDLHGDLDLPALRVAVDAALGRHEALRSTITADGTAQVVGPRVTVEVPLVDLPDPAARDAWLRERSTWRFDPTTGPLVTCAVLRLTPRHHQLHLLAHHLVTDGWSFVVLFQEVMTAYEQARAGHRPVLPDPPRYADHVAREHALAAGPEGERTAAYWRARFADGVPVLDLPTDRPRRAGSARPGRLSEVEIAVPDAALAARCRALRVTPFGLLLAAYCWTLHRLTGQDDLVVGVPVARRDYEGADLLVGHCSTVLPIRSRLTPGDTLDRYVAGVAHAVVEAYTHPGFGVELLRDRLGHDDAAELLRTLFNLQRAAAMPTATGLTTDVGRGPVANAKVDLFVDLISVGTALRGFAEYDADLFDPATVDRLLAVFARAVELFVAGDAPLDSLDPLPAADRAALLTAARGARAGDPEVTVVDLIERQAAATPDAVAVVAGPVRLSYRDLIGRADRLAARLHAAGARPGTPVGILLDRDERLPVAVLAAWKAGTGFVALDRSAPPARRAAILADAGVRHVVSAGPAAAELAGLPVTVVDPDVPAEGSAFASRSTPDDLAYVIYTSGSTGTPKGVLVGHRGLAAIGAGWRAAYRLERVSAVLQMANFGFDVFVGDVVRALTNGAKLVLCPREALLAPADLLALIRAEGIDCAEFVPVVATALARHVRAVGEDLGQLRLLIVGSDRISTAELDELHAVLAGGELVNSYGVTEATIDSTWQRHRPGSGGGSLIGVPYPNCVVHLLDDALRPVPPGTPGGLYVGGAGVALGYLGQPARTAAAFVPDPYGPPGARLYRTGDRARHRVVDGELVIELLGRVDSQVKVRGYRVEPAEVEAAVRAVTGAAEVTVLDTVDQAGEVRLVAYVATTAAPDVTGWRAELRRRLPHYLVPDGFVPVDALPLTPNGKVDTAALRALPVPAASTSGHVAPRDEAEAQLAALWAEVLGVPAVGVEDDFFALGGHSLVAARLVARVRAATGRELPVRVLFEQPTVAQVARFLAGGSASGRSRVVPVPRDGDRVGVSYAQRRLWFLSRLSGESGVYNIPMLLRVSGEVDPAALRFAFGDVLRRHEALRTLLVESGETVVGRVVEPAAAVLDVRVAPAGVDADGWVAALVADGFDLAAELPLRVGLVRDGDSWLVAVVVHHVAGDAWSMAPLARDVSVAYAARLAGAEPDWSPLPVRYADFVAWQETVLAQVAAEQEEFWRGRLAGAPAELALPFDRPRPPVPSQRGAAVRFEVDAAVHQRVTEVARAGRASVFMVVQAVFAAVLSACGAGDDVVLGTPVAGRPDEVLEELVGFFVNTVVLRTDLSGDPSLTELVGRVRDVALAAYDHQDLPFEQLVEILNPVRVTGRHPVFQVMISVQDRGRVAVELPGHTVTEQPVPVTTAKFDLNLQLHERYHPDGSAAGIHASLEYATDLFDHDTVVALAGRITDLLDAATGTPDTPLSRHDLRRPAERAAMRGWGGEACALPVETLPELIAAQVARTPAATALVAGPDTWTYAELDAWSAALAARLADRGAGPGVLVGVLVPRTPAQVAAVLAVTRTGAAFLPLDPEHPAGHVERLLDRAGVRLVATTGDLAPTLPAHVDAVPVTADVTAPVAVADRRPAADDAAYVMFTSGSTGEPKGVVVPHRGVVNTVCWWQSVAALTDADRVLFNTPLTFDPSMVELFGTLAHGATLVIGDPDGHRDPAALARLLGAARVTVAKFVPTVLREVLAQPRLREATALRQVFCGGEPLPADLATACHATLGVPLHNLYGPTEAAIETAAGPADPDGGTAIVPLGRPIWNTVVHVLDRHLRRVPPGTPGELYVSGPGVARGYLGAPGPTAAVFLPDPYAGGGARMYATGDLVRWSADGRLEYLRRRDDQLKVRGVRVEPGEVEAALRALPGITGAAVVVRDDQLVAYLTGADARNLAAVRRRLRDRLPAALVPSQLVALPALPQLANGKTDRRALADRPLERPTASSYVAPRTALEEQLVGLWSEALGRTGIGVADDFFALGGHSLVAARLVTRVRAVSGLELPVRVLFERPTVAEVARYLASAAVAGGGSRVVAVPRTGDEVGLSYAQRRLWFLTRLSGVSGVYNIPMVLRVSGAVEPAALRSAVDDVVRRHEVLRTVVVESGGVPVGKVRPVDEVTVDFRVAPAGVDADGWVAGLVGDGFDLAAELPLRVGIARDGDTWLLAVVVHHVAGDAGSMASLARDVSVAYAARLAGAEPGWSPLPVQYADFVVWQESLLKRVAAGQEEFWRRALAGAPAELPLPFDRPRPVMPTQRGAAVGFHIDAEVHQRAMDVARTGRASVFMVVQAVFAAVLSAWGAGDDVVLGTPVAGRPDEVLEELVGFFVNTVVLRTDLSGDPSLTELVARVRDVDLAAYDHQDLPFEDVVRVVNPPRALNRHPVFQVMIVAQDREEVEVELPGLVLTEEPHTSTTAKFDLNLHLRERYHPDGSAAGIHASLEYAT
ncbi:amino acid adenylation domain-containing protein, partial [Micromonospora mangrovi]